MTIGELEKRAGVTDREAFWRPYAKIDGYSERDGKLVSLGFEAGVQQLEWMAAQRANTGGAA
ncbi:hypothetical protein [Mesorhizobium sp.]|uniref:hypothetical protein n=1 Tax=Mesorhizobium sp. TaxID=1871066 RepID=UPI00122BA5A7|nr:hypothetical protein [Mesorhizobium sp.]TIN84329.1 MAG: hypothetical protein E5X97_22410 [Mesorhizobium sp.]